MIVPYETYTIKKDEVLFKQGTRCEYIFLIKSGEIISLRDNDGRIVTVNFNKEADFVGIAKEYSDMCNESAIAYSFTEVIPLPKKDIREIISKSPKWINLLMHTLSERFHDSVDLVTQHRLSADLAEQGIAYSEDDEAKYRRILRDHREI